ncbi:putative metallopeptidase [Cloacibacillus porcorum]
MESSHEFDYEICNKRIRPVADELIKKYQELRHIDVDKILFFVNHRGGGSKKRIVLARTRCMPDKWRDLFFQLGACSYFYCIEFIGKTTACLDENQMTALVYRELRMIDPEGNIVAPDTND